MTDTEKRENDERRRGRSFLFVRRAESAWTWGERLLSLFQTKAGTAAVAGVGIAGVAGGAALLAPELLGLSRPKPAAAAPERLADNSTVFTMEGRDKAGRRATFEVVILSDAFTWVRGSATDLSRDGKPIDGGAVLDQVFSREVRDRLQRSADLIAVGAASSEGAKDVEEARAETRSLTAAGWVRDLAPGKTVWKLNLGQFKVDCASCDAARDTSWQRPLIIIGVRAREGETKIDEALADAMGQTKPLPSPTCYSTFKMQKAG